MRYRGPQALTDTSVNRELAVGELLFVLILRGLTGILRCSLRRGLDGRADFGPRREEHLRERSSPAARRFSMGLATATGGYAVRQDRQLAQVLSASANANA